MHTLYCAHYHITGHCYNTRCRNNEMRY